MTPAADGHLASRPLTCTPCVLQLGALCSDRVCSWGDITPLPMSPVWKRISLLLQDHPSGVGAEPSPLCAQQHTPQHLLTARNFAPLGPGPLQHPPRMRSHPKPGPRASAETCTVAHSWARSERDDCDDPNSRRTCASECLNYFV